MVDHIIKISDLDCATLLDDVFEIICRKNSHLSSRSNHFTLDRKLPEVIFYFCQCFKLAPEAQFFAIELFQEFTRNFLQQNSKIKEKVLSFCSKSTLYILVCVQISSKMSSHYKAIPQKAIVTHLNQITTMKQQKITKRDVILAELEILKTVNYDLNFLLPLDIIDLLLFFVQNWLKENNPQRLQNCTKLKETCLSILQMVYLRQHQILTDFDRGSVQGYCKLLLSVAVICVAVFIVDDDLSEVMAVFMANKCNLDHSELLKLSVCIIENIYKNKNS